MTRAAPIVALCFVAVSCSSPGPSRASRSREAPTVTTVTTDRAESEPAPDAAPAAVEPAPAETDLAATAAEPTTPATSWTACGWGGGSYYYAAAWHPTDENVIYLGSDCAGAFRSDDKGRNWRFTNNGIATYEVLCMAVSPAAPDLIYAMTSEGLCKSTDGAETWRHLTETGPKGLHIGSAKRRTIRSIAIDPKDADVVYAGSRTGKLFKTVDGGATFKELPYRDALPGQAAGPAFTGKGAVCMVYDGNSGSDPMGRMSKVFGSGGNARDWSAYKKLSARVRLPEGAPSMQASLVVQTGDGWAWKQGAWIEGKRGAWVEVPLDLTGIPDMNAVDMVHVVVRTFQPGWKGELLVDTVALHTDAAGRLSRGQVPDGKSAVLVADWETGGDADGWKANRQTKDSLKVVAIRQSLKKQQGGDSACAVAIAPTDPSVVFVANTVYGVFGSSDAGATWTQLETPKTAYGVVVSPADAQVVWAACGQKGLYRSADGGATWTAANSGVDPKATMWEIAVCPAAPDSAYAIGSIGWSGVYYRTEDAGRTWAGGRKIRKRPAGRLPSPEVAGENDKDGLPTVVNVIVNPKNPDEVFMVGNWQNCFSTDGGMTWEVRQDNADNTCSTDIQFLDGKVYVTAMDEGLLVSEDNGGEWRQLIPLKWDKNISGHFWRVRVAAVGNSTRIVTTCSPWDPPGNKNRVFASDDGGRTFVEATGLPDYAPTGNTMWGRSYARSLAMDPKNPDVLYVGMDGDNGPDKNGPGGGIFRSADGGKSWTRCAGQPGGLRLYYGLAVDPTDSTRVFYSCCGKGGGVWRSDDEGATWKHVFQGETWPFNVDVAPSGAVLVGGGNLHRSVDHGKTWTKLTSFQDGPTIIGIAVDPEDEKRMWISRTNWGPSTQGGVFRTVDGGTTWDEITSDIPIRKQQLLRYNARTKELWSGGPGLFRIKQ